MCVRACLCKHTHTHTFINFIVMCTDGGQQPSDVCVSTPEQQDFQFLDPSMQNIDVSLLQFEFKWHHSSPTCPSE